MRHDNEGKRRRKINKLCRLSWDAGDDCRALGVCWSSLSIIIWFHHCIALKPAVYFSKCFSLNYIQNESNRNRFSLWHAVFFLRQTSISEMKNARDRKIYTHKISILTQEMNGWAKRKKTERKIKYNHGKRQLQRFYGNPTYVNEHWTSFGRRDEKKNTMYNILGILLLTGARRKRE